MSIPNTRALATGAMYAALSGLVCVRLFAHPDSPGRYDWDQHLFYYASVLKTVVEYGRWPFWNPWYCGGNVLWQNPQVALLSPVYPLALLMSLPLAMKVNIVLHYWIGFIGMHLLLRRIVGVRSLALTVYLACIFVAGGGLALHLAQGHSTFLPAFYLPLLLFWFCRAVSTGSPRDVLAAGLLLALSVLNGGLHIAPMAALGVAIVAAGTAAGRRQWRPVILAIVCGAAGFAFAAPKLVPVISFLQSANVVDERQLNRAEPMTLEMAAHAYLDRRLDPNLKFPGQLFSWHEYGNYVGLPAVLLFAVSVAWILARTHRDAWWLGASLAAAALLFLTLSLGEFGALAPSAWLRMLPFFSKFRIPSRYTIAVGLFAAATIGWSARDAGWDAIGSRAVRIAVALACTAAAADLVWRNGTHFEDVFAQPPLAHGFTWLRRPPPPQTDTAINPFEGESPMLRALVADRSTFHCYEPIKLQPIADPARPLVSADGPLKILDAAYAPDRVVVALAGGPEPSRLLLNQSYDAGWRSPLGPVAKDAHSQSVAVDAPPRVFGRFAITFVPRGLLAGWLLFAAAATAAVRYG